VNVASRVTGLARPGSVLCTEEVRDAAPEEFEWSFAGKHRLKGVEGSVPLHRAHPPGFSEHGDTDKPAKKRREDRRRRRASS
jgi:class 3 adenylate cyclase